LHVKGDTEINGNLYITQNLNSDKNINVLQSLNVGFEKNISDIETGSFEIVLPKAIVYPENGFFILFYIRDKEITLAKKIINLNCNSETKEFMKSDYTQKWTLINFPSLQYKLKILQ
jgi:hypothetical protein